MNVPPLFIDSHVHLDLILTAEERRIDWMEEHGCLPVSWSFGEGIETVNDLESYLKRKREIVHGIRHGGLICFYLAGIHPRNIPGDLKPEKAWKFLLPFLDDPFCLGIGEIGLETGSSREAEVFQAQMETAPEVAQRGKVFGIHTPRKNKISVLEETLSLLRGFMDWRNRIVIDHCTFEALARVLPLGLWAGMTVSPIKSSLRDVIRMTRAFPSHLKKIMLNTDSGHIFYEDLYQIVRATTLNGIEKSALIKNNAGRFFHIEWC